MLSPECRKQSLPNSFFRGFNKKNPQHFSLSSSQSWKVSEFVFISEEAFTYNEFALVFCCITNTLGRKYKEDGKQILTNQEEYMNRKCLTMIRFTSVNQLHDRGSIVYLCCIVYILYLDLKSLLFSKETESK